MRFEFGETNASLRYLHSVRELDADGDLLTDVCYFVSRVFERVSDRIMNLTLLTHLFSFRLNLSLFVSWHSCNRNWIDLLMRLPVPFVESWEVRSSSARLLPTGRKNSVLCAALELVRLACPRTPLSRCSSRDPQPGTKTKGSQNLLNYIPFVSFLKRAQRYHFPISCTIRQN